MKKRILSVVLAALLAITAAACGETPQSQGSSQESSQASSSESSSAGGTGTLNAPGQLPIIKDGEKLSMTMFVPGIGQFVTSFDYADNAFTKKIVDETGIDLQIVACSTADGKEKLNLMLNSGDYPDLIRGSTLTPSDLNYYAKQGIFLPVDELNLDAYSNIKSMLEQYPASRDIVGGPEGKMYALPDINDCLHCKYSGGRAWYYMPFIRDNNLTLPKTTEEYKDFLIQVRDSDFNGNGKADEVPIAFNKDSTQNFISCVAKYFMPWVDMENGSPGISVVDGKVTEQYKSEAFRQALKYMNELYSEGLIMPDSFTISTDELLAIGESPDGPAIGVQYCSWSNTAVKKAGESRRWYEYFPLPPMEGPNGPGYSGDRGPWSACAIGVAITDKCQNPEAAVALYNYLLDFDVMLDGYIGPKGQAWDDPDDGAKSLMGTDALYKLLVPYGAQEVNAGWDQNNPMCRNSDFRLGEQATDYETVEKFLSTGDPTLIESVANNMSFNEINNYYYSTNVSAKYPMPEIFLPPVVMDDTDSTRVTDIKTVLATYELQTWVEFITGARNIDTDWDAYIQELDNMGSSEMIAIMQKYVDAK